MTNGTGKPKHLQEFTMTAEERDYALCSGGEEDEYLEVEVHSPTDSSEDSVEVKVSPICLRNKRKCAEPRKVQDAFTPPPKKRMCFKAKIESPENPEPFRPWNVENQTSPSPSSKPNLSKDTRVPVAIAKIPPQTLPTTTSNLYIRPSTPTLLLNQKVLVRPQSPVQPLPLVKKPLHEAQIKTECDPSTSDSCDLRVPLHPHLASVSSTEAERLLLSSAEAFPSLHPHSLIKNDEQGCSGRKEQRNYKNMTRERRIEANARERTRVHTISAAFETLRKSVPAYSHNQKLSKLSVLRIACSYIMTLSTLVSGSAGTEGSSSADTLAECIESVSKTIQKEGKLRKKKDDTD